MFTLKTEKIHWFSHISFLSLSFFFCIIISTPVVRPDTKEPQRDESETSLGNEIGEVEVEEREKEHKVEEKQEEDKEEEMEEDDSMEWELRNTDSVFSELSELSRDYVESVDRGASVRGKLTKKTQTFFH